MKFGIYSSIATPNAEHVERAIDEVIAEAQLAESVGFDSCFFGEHHQDKDGFLPSPLIVATAVAARTRTLKGCVVLGVGIGYQPADFQAFGVPIDERVARFEESVAIGANVPAVARRAGRLADAFVGTPNRSLQNATRPSDVYDVYKEAAVAAGRTPEVIQMRDAWVAATRAEAPTLGERAGRGLFLAAAAARPFRRAAPRGDHEGHPAVRGAGAAVRLTRMRQWAQRANSARRCIPSPEV